MRKSILAAVAALSLIGASGSAAVAQSAAPLSLASLGAGAGTRDANDIRGGFILPTLAILAIVGIILLVTKGSNNPSSP